LSGERVGAGMAPVRLEQTRTTRPVKERQKRTIRGAFFRQDARATERSIDPGSSLATRSTFVNVHEGVRWTVACRRERSGGHLAMPSEMFTLDRAHAHRRSFRPPCGGGGDDGFSGQRLRYRSLQRMFDARARPRAVNPPPREAAASVRVRLDDGCPSREEPLTGIPACAGTHPGARHLVFPPAGLLEPGRVTPAPRERSEPGP
jgi:hypothetical protein